MKWADQSEDNKRALAMRVARNLREFGYPDVQADLVLEELNSTNRTIIGVMAADMLAKNGFEDME